MRYLITVAALALLSSAGCVKTPAPVASAGNPAMRLEALPPADPHKFSEVRNMQAWKNPYLVVRVDGVALLDVANNEQKILNPDKLADALGSLPASAWPYGRVVAVAENTAATSENAKATLRKNRALVAGTLENLQVLINWVPST